MNKRNGLTLSIIFKAESANYGEGYRNLAVLKKMTRGDFKEYTYISRQALRYNMVEQLNWNATPVTAQGSGESKVVQFAPTATIKDYPEIDLFGYMKTTSKDEDAGKSGGAQTRSAVVRLSNAISLESFEGDMDYLTNMGLATREGLNNAIAQSEIHHSYYGYTITIDLDRVGIDGEIEISNEEKERRIIDFLHVIEFLYRDIRGRRENLAPLFIIGGIYERKNPYFEHRLMVKNNNLNVEIIKELLTVPEVKNYTHVGLLSGIFNNTKEIEELHTTSIHQVFVDLEKEVKEYYSASN